MGALYKARHPTLNRIVLLKRLDLRGVGGAVERFRREASLMMDFKNDHIVQVHDHFKEGSHYYIVEEYVDGISLDEADPAGTLPLGGRGGADPLRGREGPAVAPSAA